MSQRVGWFGLLTALSLIATASTADAPAAPDYLSPQAWAAWPGRPSRALDVPAGLKAATAPEAAVFYIHPTTYLLAGIGNADYAPGGLTQSLLDERVLRLQTSVFNSCCRIYAPRYRQSSLQAITSNTPEGYAADELAYGDLARAFQRFLAVNPTGPFILASHSQGSLHALRLLEERIIGTPLQQRLVVAYLIGGALPVQIESQGLPVCAAPEHTGCVISWNTVRRDHVDVRRVDGAVIWWQGHYQPIAGRPLVCVNPLTWQRDGAAQPERNLGALYSEGRDAPLPAPIVGLTGAWCEAGLLGVDIPTGERGHFRDVLTLAGIYHDFDYALFYVNLRDNAQARVTAWRRSHPDRP